MALVKETGAGLLNSNAYNDVAGVELYMADRGLSWSGSPTTAQKEAAIIKATDYIDATYRFIGNRASSSQALAWPRAQATDVVEGVDIATNIVPPAVIRATSELAVKVQTGTELLPDMDRGGMINSASVGPVSVSYQNGAPVGTVYGITGILKGLILKDRGLPYGTTMSPATPFSEQPEQAFNMGQFINPRAGDPSA